MKFSQETIRRHLLLASSCLACATGGAQGAAASQSGDDAIVVAGGARAQDEARVRDSRSQDDEREEQLAAWRRTPSQPETEGAISVAFSLVQPVLNGRALDDVIFVAARGRDILLPSSFLQKNGIRSGKKDEIIKGQRYSVEPPSASMRIRLDEPGALVYIDCDADCFKTNTISVKPAEVPAPSPVSLGAFLNYDLYAQVNEQKNAYGGIAEAGLFSSAGAGLARVVCSNTSQGAPCVRLETNWTIDDPARMRRLRFGDAVTQAAVWGGAARFGGVSWGTDFSLQPNFITFPTPTISGEAALPGVVDLYINDARRFESGLPAGPFSISNLPVITGAGSAQVVVTDLLGRETVISADYYTAPQLLKRGLARFSLEAGALRKDYGVRSNDYGEGFIAGGYRRGLSDWLTASARSELSVDHQTIGASAAISNIAIGVVEIAAAYSHTDAGGGGLFNMRHEWRSTAFSLGYDLAFATPDYRRFGRDHAEARLTARSFAGYNDRNLGGLSATWTYRDERTGDDFSAIGLRYSRPFRKVAINVSVLRSINPNKDVVALLSLTKSLGGAVSASAGASYDGERAGGDFSIRRSPPVSGGFGYHAGAAFDGVDRYEVGAQYRSRYGDAAAEFSSVNGSEAGRFSLRGGAGVIAGKAFAAQSITESVAVVSVGHEKNVRIYQDRQLVARTDKNGKAAITRLRAFEKNEISLAPSDVDFAADFETVKTTVTPGFRTGHYVAFNVRRAVNVVFNLTRKNGAIETGGSVTDVETGATYPVGGEGRVYVPAAAPLMRLRYGDGGDACEAVIRLPDFPKTAPYHDIGAVTCTPDTEENER